MKISLHMDIKPFFVVAVSKKQCHAPIHWDKSTKNIQVTKTLQHGN